jgi:hypothetical protein
MGSLPLRVIRAAVVVSLITSSETVAIVTRQVALITIRNQCSAAHIANLATTNLTTTSNVATASLPNLPLVSPNARREAAILEAAVVAATSVVAVVGAAVVARPQQVVANSLMFLLRTA